jgi:hypothetical protein
MLLSDGHDGSIPTTSTGLPYLALSVGFLGRLVGR